MKINVHLPDELGNKVKEAGLNLSALLRAAAEEELYRRKTVAKTLKDSKEVKLQLEDNEYQAYVGTFTGTLIAEDKDTQVYMAEDDRVLVYDGDKLTYTVETDPEEG